jgi:ABC-2 type transport system permease protein
MRTIRYILIKEFKQIFRNRGMLPIIFVVPILQLLVLSFAVDYEIKNLKLYVVDQDHSSLSGELIHKMEASGYFIITGFSQRTANAFESIEQNESDIAIVIPTDFEKQLMTGNKSPIQLMANAIDGDKAGLSINYAGTIIRSFNTQIVLDEIPLEINRDRQGYKQIRFSRINWFNPHLDYKAYMVPGILVLLVTMIGAFLSSMNIVREKEVGTIEQLNVTPIKKYQFIIGKTLPFWLIGLFELALGLIVAKLVFDIPIDGPLWVLFSFASIYLLVVLGLGLLISTLTNTQQQAMFISWFFLVIFILMGGLFTAIENMPEWARMLTYLNPVRYFIEVNRMALLKGSGFQDVLLHFGIVGVYAFLLNAMAIWRYRKTV